jgi:hypothetical protein
MGIASDNSAYHDHYSRSIGLGNKTAQGIGPGRHIAACFKVEPKGFPDVPGNLDDIALQGNGTNKLKGPFSQGPREVPIPLLALLTYIQGF